MRIRERWSFKLIPKKKTWHDLKNWMRKYNKNLLTLRTTGYSTFVRTDMCRQKYKIYNIQKILRNTKITWIDTVHVVWVHIKIKRRKELTIDVSGCHSPGLFLMLIEHVATVSPLTHLIPLGYWFCEWSGQTLRWQYWYGQEDRPVFTSHPAPASSVFY